MAEEDEGIPTSKILSMLDVRSGKISQPLLSKDHNTVIIPPVLLPGETLILQQDKVTCVNTLWRAATGVIFLTNYRIIFTGEYMHKFNSSMIAMNTDHLAKLGYRYQEKKNLFQNMSPNIRKFVPGSKSRSLKVFRKSKKQSIKWTSNKLLQSQSLEKNSIHLLNNHQEASTSRKLSLCNDNNVVISLPILSLLDIKKFPKQYLDTEKLQMLNDGIEITTTNFLSVKLCLGEELSYDADELLCRLLKHTKVKSSTIFAYVHKGNIQLPKSCHVLEKKSAPNIYDIEKEVDRLDICGLSEWKITEQNTCEHYPEKVLLPREALEKENLDLWSSYYLGSCFPFLIWRSQSSKTLFLRSSITCTSRGDKDNRCIIDEDIIRTISTEKLQLKKLTIYTDCKSAIRSNGSFTSVNGNFINEKEPLFYPNCCVIVWDNLPDVVSAQQCAKKLHAALDKSDDSQYLRSIEESGHLQELNTLLDYSMCIVSTLNKEASHVLLSVGSGTERAAQISSLVQLLMDPFYRTLDGFQVLIQKEWCSIKFPFKKRNLIDFSSEEELSPLFLQFLECVWQIMQHFPVTFEFSEQLLEFLAEHSYSGRFGTFLNEPEPMENISATLSIWQYIKLLDSTSSMFNYNFDRHVNIGVLQPRVGIPHLNIWSWYNRYRKDKTLFEASMFATMELEKLQRERQRLFYKGTTDHELKRELHNLLDKHTILIKALSKVDESSTSMSYNSRSCSTPDISSDSASTFSTYSEDDSTSHDEDEAFRQILGTKWKSVDSLLKNRTLEGEETRTVVSKYGSSSFYSSSKDDGISAISLLKDIQNEAAVEEWNTTDKFHSLTDYLKSEGVELNDVSEVQISNMSCCGYLTKRGHNIKSWRRRWFMIDLRKKFVGYYDHSSAPTPKGVFSYMGIRSVQADKNKAHKFLFVVETFDKTYHIRAPNEKAMNLWIMCFSVPISCLAQT